MKTTILTYLLLVISVNLIAQITQQREIKSFNRIEVLGYANVIYTESDSLQLNIEANIDEINKIYTIIEGETLIIKTKGIFSHAFKIYVFNKGLNHITVNEASKFQSINTLHADSLSMDISGASDVKATIEAKAIDVLIGGASVVNIDGNTQTLYGKVSGASLLKAYKLKSLVTHVISSGASSVKVFASQKIKANAIEASIIKFKGEPKEVDVEASVSSSISKVINDEATKISGNSKDSTIISFGKKELIIINRDKNREEKIYLTSKKDFRHWNGFGIGINGWLDNGNTSVSKKNNFMDLNYGKSVNFQFKPFEKDISIYKDYVNLVTGFGFECHQYELSNKIRLNPDSNYTYGTTDTSSTYSYKKNRLKTSFINVPVLIEFNSCSNPKQSFHIAIGIIGGYKIGSKTKQVLLQNNNEIKLIKRDDYNINPFRLNAHVSIGYHNLTIYGDYSLTSLFENGKGPKLYPFTIGLQLVTF